MFLDYSHLKTRNGVRFRLEFKTDRGTFESFVDVRIKATRSMSKDGKSVANPPYVISYALDLETKKDEPISWENIENTRVYKKTLSLSIDEWYKDWLFKALIHKNVSKIFKFMKQI